MLMLRAMDSPPQDLVARATVSLGRVELLAPLFSRLDAHAPVTLVALGSSVTARAGGCSHSIIDGSASNCCGATCTSRSSGFLRSFFDYINRTWPHSEHKLFNAGVPASMPSTYVECLETWLPRDSNGSSVDLFIVEFVAVKVLIEPLRSIQTLWNPFCEIFRSLMKLLFLLDEGHCIAPGTSKNAEKCTTCCGTCRWVLQVFFALPAHIALAIQLY